MRHKILYNLSGAATKIKFHEGVTDKLLNHGFKPDIITGISSGALVAVMLGMGKYKVLKGYLETFSLDTIFDNPPVNEKGKLSFNAIRALLKNKAGLAKMTPVEMILRDEISEDEFYKYQRTRDCPTIIIGVVDLMNGSRVYRNLKNHSVDYDTFINHVVASCTIPIFTEPINGHLVDGGVRDHIGTMEALMKLGFKISKCVSVYSRPKDFKLKFWEASGFKILSVLDRVLSIMQTETSKNDEQLERNFCEKYNIHHTIYFAPDIMQSTYDVDKERLDLLYIHGYNCIPEIIKNDTEKKI